MEVTDNCLIELKVLCEIEAVPNTAKKQSIILLKEHNNKMTYCYTYRLEHHPPLIR